MTDAQAQTQEQMDAEDIQMATQQRFLLLRGLHKAPEDYRQKVQMARKAVTIMANTQPNAEDYTATLLGIAIAALDLQIDQKTDKDFQPLILPP
jgi:hypothetical protein